MTTREGTRWRRLQAIADRACAAFNRRGIACSVDATNQEARGPHLVFATDRAHTRMIEELELEGADASKFESWVDETLRIYLHLPRTSRR